MVRPSVGQANRTMQASPTTRQYAANGMRVLVVNQRVRNRTDRQAATAASALPART